MKVSFESKGDFDNIQRWLNDTSKRTPKAALNRIAKDGEKTLSLNTPKNTGETASGWVADVTNARNIYEISWRNIAHPEARVNIAKIIDQGHGTGTGGYVLPRPYIKKSMESVWKNAGNIIAKEMTK